jgi:CRISPR-associated exonuclease Cas4
MEKVMQHNEIIYLSRLQHFLFCPRQFALIELEGLWEENLYTAEGQLLHQQADQLQQRTRKNITTINAMPLSSSELGIQGVADVVEFYNSQDDGSHRPFPIEYKRGKPKEHRADEVQLCAQALCLESMLNTVVPEGALFYGQTKRRLIVVFDAELRELTLDVIAKCRELLVTAKTPAPIYEEKKCNRCSLIDLCHPKTLCRQNSARHWFIKQLEK